MKLFRRSIKRALDLLALLGINLYTLVRAVKALSWYSHDQQTLRAQLQRAPENFPFGQTYPCLLDKDLAGGSTTGHYFSQDLHIAQRIFANQPKRHIDIGSRVDGFVAHVAAYRPIEILDLRPVEIGILNIQFIACDLMAELETSLIESCDSLSCLHALEHFGLGRYGDDVAWDGHKIGFHNLHRILQQGGKLYLSVPMGPQRIEFNAHRVFSLAYLLTLIGGKYRIDQFSYIDDHSTLFTNVPLTNEQIATNFGCRFGCAIFEMTKR